jgi:Cu-Zn family superoxide dismutase
MRRVVIVVLSSLLAGCAGMQPAGDNTAMAELRNTSGANVGTATFTQVGNVVRIVLEAKGLTPGLHGVHIHAVGKCDSPDFTSAGAHFNPAGRAHGVRNPNGPHAGDLPNVYVPESGNLRVDLLATHVALQPGANSLLDADGSALVLHAFADDYVTDPSGGSGARVACGVIRLVP